MKVNVVAVGNSRGIRLNKSIIERYEIRNKVEMILEEDHIILRPIKEPRKGWTTALKFLSKERHNALLMSGLNADEKLEQWI